MFGVVVVVVAVIVAIPVSGHDPVARLSASQSYKPMHCIPSQDQMVCELKGCVMESLFAAKLGHAAGTKKSGQEAGLENELEMLACIMAQGWIREYELHLITGMSMYTAGQVSRRLAAQEQIFRSRPHGNTGHFLRLAPQGAERVGGKSGKCIKIPASWQHHAMAIQTLHYLANEFGAGFETEAAMRHHIKSGKFPDGRLIADGRQFYFEQERSRKSGPALRRQSEIIANLAAENTTCFVAYPYPAKICGGIDHETRQTNSLRHKWGSLAAPNIKLVRCHFDSLVEYRNMRVSRFEIIGLPAMVDTAESKKDQPGITGQVNGFKWEMDEQHPHDGCHNIYAILRHGNDVQHECYFTESAIWDGQHTLEYDYDDLIVRAYAEEQTFNDFVREQQKKIEKQVEMKTRMRVSNAQAVE